MATKPRGGVKTLVAGPLRKELFLRLPVQSDQLNMAVRFWYLVESDLSCVHVYRSVH